MRVLHVIPSLSPRRGGPTTAIFPMVAALRARGIDAEIAASDEDMPEAGHPSPRLTMLRQVPVRLFSRWSPCVRSLRDYAFCPQFAPWLDKNLSNYDLIHTHALFSHLPSTAMRVALRYGVPYVNRPLGLLGRWPLRQSTVRKRFYLRWMEKQNLEGADALHFTSERERDEAADVVAPRRSAVIPHGMETSDRMMDAPKKLRARLGLPPDQRLVIFLGRIHPKKGLDLLVRALAQMPAPRPTLLVAGEGDHRAAIERLAVRLGVARDLRWLGHVTGEWKQLCLQGADLFALTSHDENFGMAVIEALAAGTPVLISDRVALAGMIARHQLGRVVPLEIGAIRHGLAQLLAQPPGDNPAPRRAFVQEHYSWSANAEALEKLYQLVLDNRSRRRAEARLQHPQPTL